MMKKLLTVLIIFLLASSVFAKPSNPFYKPTYKPLGEKYYKVGEIVVDENEQPIAIIIRPIIDGQPHLGVALDQGKNLAWSTEDADGYKAPFKFGSNGRSNQTVFFEGISDWGEDGEKYPAWAFAKNYNAGGFDDWYIPSVDELDIIYKNRKKINDALEYLGYPTFQYNMYWSTNQFPAEREKAYFYNFNFGVTPGTLKTEKKFVCVIREF